MYKTRKNFTDFSKIDSNMTAIIGDVIIGEVVNTFEIIVVLCIFYIFYTQVLLSYIHLLFNYSQRCCNYCSCKYVKPILIRIACDNCFIFTLIFSHFFPLQTLNMCHVLRLWQVLFYLTVTEQIILENIWHNSQERDSNSQPLSS